MVMSFTPEPVICGGLGGGGILYRHHLSISLEEVIHGLPLFESK